jgi:hypothetical protein
MYVCVCVYIYIYIYIVTRGGAVGGGTALKLGILYVVKRKVNPITDHEGPVVEYRYSSTVSLISALDGVGGQRHAPVSLPPRKTR